MIGKRLAHYDLTALVGKGGMGEVYRATDTRLGREVAIKILPRELSGDPERAARFEREARTLASLQHPNVASIYGYEEADGVRFLAMELVEGQDLAERLAAGSLPLNEALEIAHQVAVGLEAAHEKGILHRDLKPANVKVGLDGTVKILDFGLARAYTGDTDGGADLANSPTITAAMTQAGTILGTAAYMSPEQAKGKPLDRRSDIWSYGVMVYEMLVGQQLFAGETLGETMAEVLKGSLDLDALPAATPPAVRQLLRRCLDRDPATRLRDIGEARIVLADPHRAPEGAALAGGHGGRSSRLPWALAGVLLVALAGVLAWGWVGQGGVAEAPSLHFSINNDTPVSLRSGDGRALAISPDGEMIVSISSAEDRPVLFLRRLDSFEASPIMGTENANQPTFSPDGKWLAFVNYQGLFKTSVSGGAPVLVADTPASVWGISWGTDGFIYLISTQSLMRVPEAGGAFETVYQSDQVGAYRYPHALPGGRGVLLNTFTGGSITSRLMVYDLVQGEMKDLQMPGNDARYLDCGVVIFAQGGQVMGARFDVDALEFTGSQSPVLQRAWIEQDLMHLDVARNGTVAYLPAIANSRASLLMVDREGQRRPLIPGPVPFAGCSDPRLSPDGKRLALSVEGFQIWILDLETETPTIVSENGFYPVWSADGRELTYGSTRNRSFDLYRVPTDFSSPERILLDKENNLRAATIAPDGVFIFREEIPGKGMDLFYWPDEDPANIRGLLEGPDDELAPDISPDGRWIAYVSGLSGRDEVYVTSFPDPGARIQISNGGGTSPAWSVDGREIFYMDGEQLVAARVEADPGLRVLAREPLFAGSYLQYRWHRQYEVHPDGEHLVMIENPPRGEIEVITHWFADVVAAVGAK